MNILEVRAIEQAFVDGEQTGAFTGGGMRRYGGNYGGYNGFNNGYGGMVRLLRVLDL